MSDKQNFSIDGKLLTAHPGESVSGEITRVLKLASENLDDFIRYTRAQHIQLTPETACPSLSDLVLNGSLRYNLSVDAGGISLFFAKGVSAKIRGGRLTVDRTELDLDDGFDLWWHTEQNDFNADVHCVKARIKGGEGDV